MLRMTAVADEVFRGFVFRPNLENLRILPVLTEVSTK